MRSLRLRLLVVAVAVSGSAISIPPLWRETKAFRARHIARQAESAMGAGDRRLAAERVAVALRLAPQDTAVLRTVARYDFLQRDPRAISLWIRLVERNRASAQDWEGLIQSAFQVGDRVLAVRALEGFRQAAPQEKRKAKQYESRVLQLWGKWQAAADTAKWVLRQEEPDPGFSLFAHELMLQGNERQKGESRKWLWEQAADDGQNGLSASILLARVGDLTATEKKTLTIRLRLHPQATWETRVLAESLDIASGARGPVAGAWAEFGQSLDTKDRIRTARWLVSTGNARYASGLVSELEARAHRDAFFAYIDILGAEKRWEVLLAFLETRPPFLSESLNRAYQTRAAEKLGNSEMSERYWKLAVSGARRNLPWTVELANYAGVLGWHERAGELCRGLVQTPGGEVQGWLGLLALARRTKDDAGEKEALQALRQKAPRLFPPQTAVE